MSAQNKMPLLLCNGGSILYRIEHDGFHNDILAPLEYIFISLFNGISYK